MLCLIPKVSEDLISPMSELKPQAFSEANPSPYERRCRQADEGALDLVVLQIEQRSKAPHPALCATFSRREKEKPAQTWG